MNTTIVLAFACLLLLIGVIYYQGLVADLGATSSAVSNFGNVFSGRTTTGTVSGYAH